MSGFSLFPTITPILQASNIPVLFKSTFTWDSKNKKPLPDIRNTSTTYSFQVEESWYRLLSESVAKFLKSANLTATNYALKLEEFESKVDGETRQIKQHILKVSDRNSKLGAIKNDRLYYFLNGNFVLSSGDKGYAINFVVSSYRQYDPYTGGVVIVPDRIESNIIPSKAGLILLEKNKAELKPPQRKRKEKSASVPIPSPQPSSSFPFNNNFTQVKDIFEDDDILND